MKKILPILLALIGTGAGIGAGMFMKNDAPNEETVACSEPADDIIAEAAPSLELEFVKLNNQFVVPLVGENRVHAMMVMALSLEAAPGNREKIYAIEPKLRDQFLQVMFDHANVGAFDGNFTNSNSLDVLRRGLLDATQGLLGKTVTDVLITDIARQDL